MPGDPVLEELVKSGLGNTRGLSEKAMFGGWAYLLHGNLLIGARRRSLLLRVGKDNEAWANEIPGVHRRFSFVTSDWLTTTRPNQYFGEIKMATSTLKTSTLPREVVFNGSRIPDPDPQMSIDQVRDLLTPSYPEIATATMTGPEDTGTSLRYSFSRAIGSKG